MSVMLNGKVALVTGGASGIGQAAALLFARQGAKVAVADIDAEAGAETVRTIERAGGDLPQGFRTKRIVRGRLPIQRERCVGRDTRMTVCTGAELEVGWLPMIERQAANTKIQPGAPGSYTDHLPLYRQAQIYARDCVALDRSTLAD